MGWNLHLGNLPLLAAAFQPKWLFFGNSTVRRLCAQSRQCVFTTNRNPAKVVQIISLTWIHLSHLSAWLFQVAWHFGLHRRKHLLSRKGGKESQDPMFPSLCT